MKLKYRNIVVSGDVGTGTSTLSQYLAKKLNWKYLSAGDIFREYHKKYNIPLWNKMALPDDFERKVDKEFLEKIKFGKNLVVDSHYSGWFAKDMKDVFKILLIADKEVVNHRILNRQHTHKETVQEIEERRKQLKRKFKHLYTDEDYENPKIFDLILDTTEASIAETLRSAYSALLK